MVETKITGKTSLFAGVALGAAALIAGGSIAYRALHDRIAPGADALREGPAIPAAMIANLEQRMSAAPGDAEGWRTLGWSYFQVRRYRDAAGAYARATRLLPMRADIWSALGEAQTLTVNAVDQTAHMAFAKALSIDPRDARARYFLAVEKDVAGDHRGAVDDWIALLKDSPPDAPYAKSVHDLVAQVAARGKIDIADRLPEPALPTAGGDAVAGAAIPGPTPEQMGAAAQLSPSQQDAMARGMVDGLAQRLTRNPRDADGWIRLMRARMVLGDKAAGAKALADARHAFTGDATTLARFADAARTLDIPDA
jgi:cytochrome c-type biogenesis protein CcmH